MFKKIFEYAGPYKKNMYVATVVVLVSVLMGVLPFVLAYQVISPLVMGDSVETEFVLLRVIGVLICLVLQAVSKLRDRECLIMELRFGLNGRKEHTQKQVADKLGISQSYISRLEKKIIRQLKIDLDKAV